MKLYNLFIILIKMSSTIQNESKNELLKATKPCQYVVKNIENGKVNYKKCTRAVCTFAHTLDELRLVPCGYGSKCYRQYNTGNLTCQYHHPGETKDEYYKRTGKAVPVLPTEQEVQNQKKQQEDEEKEKYESLTKNMTKLIIDVEEEDLQKEEDTKKDVLTANDFQVENVTFKDDDNKKVIRVPRELLQEVIEVLFLRDMKNVKIQTF